MAMDTVYPQRDNPLVINFTFEVDGDPSFGLDGFDDIEVEWLGVVYTLLLNPDIVVVNSNTQLQLNFGSVTDSDDIPTYLKIIGFNTDYPDGYVLTNKCAKNLSIPCIC